MMVCNGVVTFRYVQELFKKVEKYALMGDRTFCRTNLAERRLLESHFAERTFCPRTFADRTFCRSDNLTNRLFSGQTICRKYLYFVIVPIQFL